MNAYMIQDKENKNYLINPKRWTTKIYLARTYTQLSKAKEIRAKLKPKKCDIVEYELVERRRL